jgi:hypothetical protein
MPAPAGVKKLSITLTPNMGSCQICSIPMHAQLQFDGMTHWSPTIHGVSQQMHRSIATIATLIDAKSFSNMMMMMMMMLLHLDWC